MPFIAALIAAFVAAIGAMAVRAIIGVGIGLVTYNFVIPPILSAISSQLSGAPATVLQVLGVCRVDVAVTILLSAVAAKFSVAASIRKAA